MVQTAKDAEMNQVIDGCPVDCARRIFERHGLANCRYIRVMDLGIEKVKGARCAHDQVDKVVAKAKEVLGPACKG
jgi:uncharacterized metal-binding protein